MLPRRNPAIGSNTVELGNVDDNTHPKIVEILVHKAINLDSTQLLAAVTKLVMAMEQEKEASQSVGGTRLYPKEFL